VLQNLLGTHLAIGTVTRQLMNEPLIVYLIAVPSLFQELPGRYRRLDLFIQVLRHMCPNLTDASLNSRSLVIVQN